MGKWTYHMSHSYKIKDGISVSFATQLYQIGVYAIVNNDQSKQSCMTPKNIVACEEILRKAEKEGKISDLVFGQEITVSDDTGLFIEVKP